MKIFSTYCASLTPINKDYSINNDVFYNHCNNLFNQGADGIVLYGTTGEANLLSIKSKMQSLESIIAKGIDRSKLLVGTGLASIEETISFSKETKNLGTSGILVLPSYYYNNPSDQGVIDYFSYIIESIAENDLKMILYHIPKISGVSINHNIIHNLINKYPNNIVGIKDSENDLNKMIDTIKKFPNFKVFSGSDSLALHAVREGAAGAITATANLSVSLLSYIIKNANNSDMNEKLENASDLQDRIRKIVFSQEQISFMKAVLKQKDNNKAWSTLMPPLISLENEDSNKNVLEVKKLLSEINNYL